MAVIFSGNYASFDEIPDSHQYKIKNSTPNFYQYSLSQYKEKSFFPNPISNEYNHIRDITSLCISLLCSNAKSKINILDVGGGFGVSYIELIKRGQLKNFNYTVYETDIFFQHYQSFPFFEENNISFINSLEKISQAHQLIVFGSSLQYFSDYSQTLRDIIQRSQNPKYILLTHTPITSNPTFATAQVNMDSKKIPNWIFNIDSLIQTFSENGYSCIFKSAIHREGLFDDFKNETDNYRSANCLFTRNEKEG